MSQLVMVVLDVTVRKLEAFLPERALSCMGSGICLPLDSGLPRERGRFLESALGSVLNNPSPKCSTSSSNGEPGMSRPFCCCFRANCGQAWNPDPLH